VKIGFITVTSLAYIILLKVGIPFLKITQPYKWVRGQNLETPQHPLPWASHRPYIPSKQKQALKGPTCKYKQHHTGDTGFNPDQAF